MQNRVAALLITLAYDFSLWAIKDTSHILEMSYLVCTCPSWLPTPLFLKRGVIVGKQVVHPVNYELLPSYSKLSTADSFFHFVSC